MCRNHIQKHEWPRFLSLEVRQQVSVTMQLLGVTPQRLAELLATPASLGALLHDEPELECELGRDWMAIDYLLAAGPIPSALRATMKRNGKTSKPPTTTWWASTKTPLDDAWQC